MGSEVVSVHDDVDERIARDGEVLISGGGVIHDPPHEKRDGDMVIDVKERNLTLGTR